MKILYHTKYVFARREFRVILKKEVDPTNLFLIIPCGVLLLGVSAVHLFTCYYPYPKTRNATKVLLMPLLCALYIVSVPEPRLLVIGALLFGWLGDILLLFQQKQLLLFLGVCAFALGHHCYMAAMVTLQPVFSILILIPIVLCVFWLIFVTKKLLPYTPRPLKLPGFLYALVLSCTALSALYMLLLTKRLPFLIAFFGGTFFMLSDALLTGQHYRKELRHGSFYVMLTYLIAQGLLVLGLILLGGN